MSGAFLQATGATVLVERWGAAVEMDELFTLGRVFDERPAMLGGRSVGMWLAEAMLKVRSKDGRERPLEANAVQERFEEERGRRNIVLKARQMGMTTWVSGRFFLKTVLQPGVLSVQVAQTREAAEAIFRTVQRFHAGLPEDLRKGALRLSRSNAGQMVFGELDSEFRVLSAGDENAGRGLTIQNLHCSELSRWGGQAALTLAGLRAALTPGGELVMESTPNGAYGCFYDEWRSAEERGTVRHFFPWWMEAAYRGAPVTDPTADEARMMREHGLDAGQIGFRRGLEREYRALRAQEFAEDAETCFRAAGESYFDMEAVERRLQEAPPPAMTREGGTMEVWLPPIAGREYVLGVDTAGGGADGDYAVIEVLELETGLQCAELRRHLHARDLAAAAVRLAREYGGATVAVERNNHGAAVLAYLETEGARVRLYEQEGVAGWLTTAASRPRMLSRLATLLVESPALFQSRRFLLECRSFVVLAGGGTGAAAGTHDDCVMAMAVAHSVRAELLTGRAVRRVRLP